MCRLRDVDLYGVKGLPRGCQVAACKNSMMFVSHCKFIAMAGGDKDWRAKAAGAVETKRQLKSTVRPILMAGPMACAIAQAERYLLSVRFAFFSSSLLICFNFCFSSERLFSS